jgi:hypothetical protein
LALPCVAAKLKLVVLMVNVGVGAETVSEIGIDRGELVAPVPVTVTDVV